jgi:hypothetical protein
MMAEKPRNYGQGSTGLAAKRPNDPEVRVLRVAPENVEFWDTRGNSITIASKLASARVIGRPPDLGENRKVQMTMLRRTSITPPKIFERVRYQRRVDGGADDRPMAKSSLDYPGVVPLVARAYPQACRSMCACALSSRPALAAVGLNMRAKPAVVNGEPRSLTKTKGDKGLSRWSRRSARNSSPWLQEPFLTRRTRSTRR